MTDSPPPSPAVRRASLPARRQAVILGVAAIGALLLLFGLPQLARLLAPRPPPPPAAPPPGTFQATPEQWSTLKFATAELAQFRDESRTDGRVALDDDRTTQVFSPFSGVVTRVLAKAGDHVRAGQALFAVRAAEFVQGQSDLATALAAVASARAQVTLAQAAEARQRDLFKANGAAQKDVQQSEADLAAARGVLVGAEASLGAVRNRLRILGKSDAQIAALERQSTSAAGGETVVAAPIGGAVMSRAVGVGQNIASVSNGGTAPAFVISDLSSVWLVGALRAADAPKARVGEPIEVTTPDLPGRIFHATLDFVAPAIDPTTHRLPARAKVANPDGELKPEMFAAFTLFTGPSRETIAVPESAVVLEGDTARVWVAGAGRTLALRQIIAGPTIDGRVEVRAGLRAGERVVTSGALFIDRAASSD